MKSICVSFFYSVVLLACSLSDVFGRNILVVLNTDNLFEGGQKEILRALKSDQPLKKTISKLSKGGGAKKSRKENTYSYSKQHSYLYTRHLTKTKNQILTRNSDWGRAIDETENAKLTLEGTQILEIVDINSTKKTGIKKTPKSYVYTRRHVRNELISKEAPPLERSLIKLENQNRELKGKEPVKKLGCAKLGKGKGMDKGKSYLYYPGNSYLYVRRRKT
mmetsp:Transcript_12872/g.18458  ORF Transcript_12872/g.18458 Transcript_12872/m.18458 type:complete len:220 (-) Transcript_12872:2356-3015(-)